MNVVEEEASEKSSESHSSSLSDDMASMDQIAQYYESEWSEAGELLNQDEESFPGLTSFLAQ
jgi:hypothetical protein